MIPKPKFSELQLWREPENNIDSSDIVVKNFRMGLYMGAQEYEWKSGSKCTKALVLDNATMKFGWVDIRFIQRVD